MIRGGTRFEGESHEQWRIDSVLRRLGWDGAGKRRGQWFDIRCPFHQDSNASAGFNEGMNSFRCQACDAKGNSVTLVMQQLNLSAADAVEWLKSNLSTSGAGAAQVAGQTSASWVEPSAWKRR